jgi:hypothetical protein
LVITSPGAIQLVEAIYDLMSRGGPPDFEAMAALYGTYVTGLGSCSYATRSKRGANSAACAYIYGYDMVAGMTYSGGKVIGDLATFRAATGGQLYGHTDLAGRGDSEQLADGHLRRPRR